MYQSKHKTWNSNDNIGRPVKIIFSARNASCGLADKLLQHLAISTEKQNDSNLLASITFCHFDLNQNRHRSIGTERLSLRSFHVKMIAFSFARWSAFPKLFVSMSFIVSSLAYYVYFFFIFLSLLLVLFTVFLEFVLVSCSKGISFEIYSKH